MGDLELIDTLWNVNTDKNGQDALDLMELIDTLWNVNQPTPLNSTTTGEN